MLEPLPKVGVLLACFFERYTNWKIHKLVSRRDHLNISTMYSVFDWKELFEILSHRQTFLESTEISASEEPNTLEKAPVQFMPLQKLSRKCHFLVWFCMSNWNGTYFNYILLMYVVLRSRTNIWLVLWCKAASV